MFTPPDIPYFNILGFHIYYYGIVLALAILVGVIISDRIAVKKYSLSDLVYDISPYIIIGGIVGARLYYCILNAGYYLKFPLDIFNIREGGLSIHGAILGGALVLYFIAKNRGIGFGKLCDIITLGVPIAQAIGRFGNFFNSEAFGYPTDLAWKMYISPEHRPSEYKLSEYFHPTFLYESVLDIVIFVILYRFIFSKEQANCGVICAWYLILYSLVRLFIEALRVDCVSYICNIPTPQIVSILIIIVSSVYILIVKNLLRCK